MSAIPRRVRALCTSVLLASLLSAALGADASEEAVCRVVVERLPAASLAGGGYELWISGQGTLALPSSGEVAVEIAEPVVVRLQGAAYHGELRLAPEDCRDDRRHVLEAVAKPARLVFHTVVPLRELVVSCVSGCEQQLRPAEWFPELVLPDGELEMVVVLEFKARGYRAHVGEYKLYPGDNVIRVNLERLE